MQKIIPCLWFDSEGEEAARFYASIFKNSKVGKITRYGKEGFEIHRRPEGSAMTVDFRLAGQDFTALNGGPVFKFNEAISFQVMCKDQKEVDYFWRKLGAGGDPNAQQCGWLKDKYGLSWQIVPVVLMKLMASKDKKKAGRVMDAMLKMKKIDIKTLEKAAKGK
jgi:predicted 3-demethylubiquinone-9 3-methyltransferase (glyoxalase superfamily)